MGIAILLIVLSDILLSYLNLKNQRQKNLPEKIVLVGKTTKIAILFKDYVIRQLIIVCLIGNVIWPNSELWLKIDLPLGIKFAGLLLALAALALRQWSYRELNSNWSPRVSYPDFLVTTGPYRFVRHPIYLSYLFMARAAILATGSITLFLSGLFFFATDKIRANAEEKILAEKFGWEYLVYVSKVGRFIPLKIASFSVGVMVSVVLLGFIVGSIDEIYLMFTGKSFTFIPTATTVSYCLNKISSLFF